MRAEDKYVRFDWAIKRMLRDKANFDVLEGFISVFTGENVKIDCILESESNQDSYDDKYNRVDVKARNSDGEIYIIEVQLSREVHYLERIVYGTAKAITEQLHLKQSYYDIKKVISISIVYFDLGKGSDYLYHGQVQLRGVHNNDILTITPREKKGMNLPDFEADRSTTRSMRDPSDVFPEYYLIRVNEFNTYAKTPIEEWMDYLKNGIIDDHTKTPGLSEAKDKLQYLMMSESERHSYERHLDAMRVQNDVIGNMKAEGYAEGRAEGLAVGRAQGLAQGIEIGIRKNAITTAKFLKSIGVSIHDIAQATNLSDDEIVNL